MTHAHQIHIRQLNFFLPDGKQIFHDLNVVFGNHKIGLVGKNGIGKSTLLRLISSELPLLTGSIHVEGKLAYVPQLSNFLATPEITIANLLGFEEKIQALQRIYQSSTDVKDFSRLNEDWQIEERLQQQLHLFGLHHVNHNTPLKQLSGGEITQLLLTRAFFSGADFLLLDELTNHLDTQSKQRLYQTITDWQKGIIIASHDRTLLNFVEEIIELNTQGATHYGGNYTDYINQKSIEQTASRRSLEYAKKSLQKTYQTIQTSREKHEKKQSYGQALRKSHCIDKMAANSKKGRSERTQRKLLIKQERLIHQAETNLRTAKNKIEINEEIHVELEKTYVPNGKLILNMEKVTFSYPTHSRPLIKDFNLQLFGAKRIALTGRNGSGKTTLVNLILGNLKLITGSIYLGTQHVCYLDQQNHLLKEELSLLENFLHFNPDVKEYDAYRCLAAFLFKNQAVHKKINHLSGGEKMRAALACVFMKKQPPQLLILDEPTNHLDLASILQIESALKNYQGALIVISHDEKFLENIEVNEVYPLHI